MIRFFYDAQTFSEARGRFIKKVTYRMFLFMLRRVVPIYYFINRRNDSGVSSRDRKNSEPQVILSLTTFPPRMKNIWQVLESLLRQTHKPDKIILWLAKTQFPTIDHIDVRVRGMVNRGVEIRFCEDLRSHKKYFYAMKEYENDIVITVDDDIYYPEYLVERLLTRAKELPNTIIAYRAHQIKFLDGKVQKYTDWDLGSKGISEPDHSLMATGCGGVLYPPKCLDQEVFNLNAIRELCPNADDIWLKFMGYKKGTKTAKVKAIYSEMFSTPGSHKVGLAKKNVSEGQNDVQFKNVIERYGCLVGMEE